MNYSNKKREIIESALGNLEEFSGWKTVWTELEGRQSDGLLRLERKTKSIELEVIVKGVVQEGHLPQLLQRQKAGKLFLIIADRISKNLMATLKHLGINYLESGGNAYIDTEPLFLLIEGKKSGQLLGRKHVFTNASIKLLFYLLLDPELLKRPYREIAEITGASLDNISKTIRALRANDYITALKEGGYVFIDKEGLLARWVPEYGERLRPKLLMGRYRLLRDVRWKEIQLNAAKTRWGGEPAVDKSKGLLRAQIFTLYTAENKQDLIRKYQLIPDPQGDVHVYRAFWGMETFGQTDIVPELLIYADLLLSGSARNAEAAKELFDAKKETIV